MRATVLAAMIVAVAAACTWVVLRPMPARLVADSSCGQPGHPAQYIGVITSGYPGGTKLRNFAHATGVRPTLVPYFVSFRTNWNPSPACLILRTGALPVIQINPRHVPLAEIVAGRWDHHLEKYAQHVRDFGFPVVISFGHEMNGHWYSWGYRHTPPAVFVAAWRHIVTIFRQQRAGNVTWLWTVNIIDKHGGIPSPGPWWPGDSYVNWVGIDGYYLKPAWTFASLFGPTIRAVHTLTLDPILITETAASPAADQPAKIADLAAGIRHYGLLGFVWFDIRKKQDWRLIGPAATAAYRQAARSIQGTDHE